MLAIAKPGNLADDNDETAASTSSTSSSFVESSTTASTGAVSTSSSTPTTTVASTTTTAASGGSGLGTGGAGEVGDGMASSTGGPMWLLPVGTLLLAVGVGGRRLLRVSSR